MNSLIICYLGAGLLCNLSTTGESHYGLANVLAYFSPFRYADEVAMRRLLTGKNQHVAYEITEDLFGFTWGYEACFLAIAGWAMFFLFLGLFILLHKHSRS